MSSELLLILNDDLVQMTHLLKITRLIFTNIQLEVTSTSIYSKVCFYARKRPKIAEDTTKFQFTEMLNVRTIILFHYHSLKITGTGEREMQIEQ